MNLSVDNRILEFRQVPLRFEGPLPTNLFARKNNKTVGETLGHRKYSHLKNEVLANYPACLQRRLGEFLLELKLNGHALYKRFLNAYGDDAYCAFSIADSSLSRQMGLYCFIADGTIKYVGKSTDSFAKRITQGYGHIHPKNCYRDGQATNCHSNALIAKCREQMTLFVCPMTDVDEIQSVERKLIGQAKPDWNIQLKLAF